MWAKAWETSRTAQALTPNCSSLTLHVMEGFMSVCFICSMKIWESGLVLLFLLSQAFVPLERCDVFPSWVPTCSKTSSIAECLLSSYYVETKPRSSWKLFSSGKWKKRGRNKPKHFILLLNSRSIFLSPVAHLFMSFFANCSTFAWVEFCVRPCYGN